MRSEVEFSRNLDRGDSLEEITIYRQSDHRDLEASRVRHAGAGAMPRAWDQLCHVLQVAIEVRRHGGFHGFAHEGAGGRESASEEDVCRGPDERGHHEGGALKKMVRPSQRREVARWA